MIPCVTRSINQTTGDTWKELRSPDQQQRKEIIKDGKYPECSGIMESNFRITQTLAPGWHWSDWGLCHHHWPDLTSAASSIWRLIKDLLMMYNVCHYEACAIIYQTCGFDTTHLNKIFCKIKLTIQLWDHIIFLEPNLCDWVTIY